MSRPFCFSFPRRCVERCGRWAAFRGFPSSRRNKRSFLTRVSLLLASSVVVYPVVRTFFQGVQTCAHALSKCPPHTAGGYDAIWLLVCDPVEAEPDIPPFNRVERVWSSYTALDVSPLSTTESLAGGACLEDLEAIPGLKQSVVSE